MDYKKAGVDIEAGYQSVELMKEHVKKTNKHYQLPPHEFLHFAYPIWFRFFAPAFWCVPMLDSYALDNILNLPRPATGWATVCLILKVQKH